MQADVPITQRAFEIAQSGSCASITDLRKQLRREGYDANEIVGRALIAQLRKVIADRLLRKPRS